MAVEVLATPSEIFLARTEIRRRRLDYVVPKYLRVLHKTRLLKGVGVGDVNKSWDILKTIEFLEHRVDKSAAVLDLGAYGSELLCSLHKLGFSKLTGIDLNPRLTWMPYSQAIRYVIGNFAQTSFAPASFSVVTAISVLEHGFCGAKVLREVSRLLKPGGYFLGSVDYWPEKIDTTGITAFGMDWRIFSKSELAAFVQEASDFGLFPVGPLSFDASARTADWCARRFTYAWFALQKSLNS
jgi:SAM-dependent methyltransferase